MHRAPQEIGTFGHGSFVGSVMADPTFYDQPLRDQARAVGWAAGCPIVLELIDPTNNDSGRGPEAMLNRYGEVSFWFGQIVRTAEELNPDLHNQLTSNVPRQEGEDPLKFEIESIPITHLDRMSPLSTITGFALPRVLIEQFGTTQNLSREEVQTRLVKGMNALERAVTEARTPAELLAMTAEDLIVSGHTQSSKALKHMLGQGWMDEHNAQSMIDELKSTMQDKAPVLWSVYSALSEEEKRAQELV